MTKRQTLTFHNPSIDNYTDVVFGIADDMQDSDFVDYIRSIRVSSNVDYLWDDDTSTLTCTRTWTDSDYNSYITNWGSNRDATRARLESRGYTLSEEVEDLE